MEAVKASKGIPVGISLRRHILKRLPACKRMVVISLMQGKENANYTSITIFVGHNEYALHVIYPRNFRPPPRTGIHQYRSNTKHYGLRLRKGSIAVFNC